jgi:nucleotide-binding universal stress UspA family protein
MIRTILVPVDGSSFSEQAIPVAVGIAHRTGATIELAMAYDTYGEAVSAGLGIAVPPAYQLPATERIEDGRVERSAYLAALGQRLRAESGKYVRSELLEGSTVDALADRARRRADLVVMSTHARGGLSRLWLGSVADALIRDISVPVVLVKPNEADTSRETAGIHRFRSVVVALDGSSFAEAVLEPLMAVVRATPVQVLCTLLQVRSSIPVSPMTTLRTGSLPTTQLNGRFPTEHDYLQDVTKRLRAHGLQVQPRTVVHEQTGPAILEVAREVEADLIALATHGRGGLRRYLIGSIADEVLRGADSTVLIYRPAG